MYSTFGMFASTQSRHWAQAWPCVEISPDIADFHPGAGHQDEADGHQSLADDPQLLAGRDGIQGRRDATLHGILDGHHGGIGGSVTDLVQRSVHIGGGNADGLDGARHLHQRRLGERPLRAEEGVGDGRRGHGLSFSIMSGPPGGRHVAATVR